MSVENQTATDTPTHTPSPVKAALHHVWKGASNIYNENPAKINCAIALNASFGALFCAALTDTVFGVAVTASASAAGTVAVTASAIAGAVAVTAGTVATVFGVKWASKDTHKNADDISPELAQSYNILGSYGMRLTPFVFAIAVGVATVPYFPEQPPAAPQTPMTTQFYKVSGTTNDNCQLIRTPETIKTPSEFDTYFIRKGCKVDRQYTP